MSSFETITVTPELLRKRYNLVVTDQLAKVKLAEEVGRKLEIVVEYTPFGRVLHNVRVANVRS